MDSQLMYVDAVYWLTIAYAFRDRKDFLSFRTVWFLFLAVTSAVLWASVWDDATGRNWVFLVNRTLYIWTNAYFERHDEYFRDLYLEGGVILLIIVNGIFILTDLVSNVWTIHFFVIEALTSIAAMYWMTESKRV